CPVPLAALAADYTLRASPRATAADAAGDSLAAVLSELPLPVVSLPTGAAREPWLLVLLAHEVGHHAQHDLRVVAATEAAVAAAGARFAAWHQEIFADACAVAFAGAAALFAIAELEWGPPEALLAAGTRYPAPAVRLALMAAIARELGAWAPAM